MSAGVPLTAHVGGVAMGMVKEGDQYAVLTDPEEDGAREQGGNRHWFHVRPPTSAQTIPSQTSIVMILRSHRNPKKAMTADTPTAMIPIVFSKSTFM